MRRARGGSCPRYPAAAVSSSVRPLVAPFGLGRLRPRLPRAVAASTRSGALVSAVAASVQASAPASAARRCLFSLLSSRSLTPPQIPNC